MGQNDIKNVQNTLFAVQGQQRKCVAPPSRYVLDRSNPTAFADEFNTIYLLDWTNYAEQQKEITSQQHLSSEGQSQGLILIRKCSLRPIIARLMTPFHASTMSTSYM